MSSPGRPTIRSACTCTPVCSRRKRRLSSAAWRCPAARLISACTSSLNVCMPTSNCSAPGGNRRMQLPQRLRQPVGDHLEVQEHRVRSLQLSRKNCRMAADVEVQVERAVDELELPHAAREQRVHLGQERLERRRPGGVERRQAELALERAAARRFDVETRWARSSSV